jgi:phospholipid/cholesterol/gamma-HCH transport system substrate-binding protein
MNRLAAVARRSPRRPLNRLVVAVVVLATVVTGALLFQRSDDQTLTAYFSNSNGIYEGDEVRILGVPVGTVEDIEPTDHGVRVRFRLDNDVKVPADAHAVIMSPSLVSSRYLQLTPQYSGGPVMGDDAVIPLERTAVPVEFDEIKDQLDRLATDFGPQGVNKDGALSEFVTTTGNALAGKGQAINDTIAQLSRAVETLNTGSADIFGTLDNLQTFVSALATSDQQIREFGKRLSVVSAVLASNRTSLRQGLQALGTTVREVRGFVHDNRNRILATARGLSDVLVTVASQRDAIEQILHVGPNALRNLFAAYHQRENSISAGLQLANTNNLRQFVCGAVGSVGPQSRPATRACVSALGPLLDALSMDVPLSTQLLAQLEATLGLTGGGR